MQNKTKNLLFVLGLALLAYPSVARAEEAPPVEGAMHAAPLAAPAVEAAPPTFPSLPKPAVTAAPGPVAGDVKTTVSAKFAAELYGFVELDTIHDSTQSFDDLAGNGLLARGNYAASHQRTMFGVRNSRLGFKMKGPDSDLLKTSAIMEMDFLGNQPGGLSQSGFFASPTFRIRHFALKLDTPVVNILFGQYWQLFGWQSYYHPNTVEIQGVPGQIYSRSPQIRLTHVFATDPVNVEIAVAAVRPPQRDSSTPDAQGGLRLVLNDWKGLHTAGGTGTAIDGLSVGVSGVFRHFEVDEFSSKPTSTRTKNGSGISVDALLPVIPATPDAKGNSLTLTGSFVRGTGISDLYTGLNGGLTFPSLPASGSGTAQTYSANIDNGLVAFDGDGNLHTINWLSYMAGFQYYLPPTANVWISGNLSYMKSSNLASFAADRTKVFDHSMWADGNLFVDLNKAVRLGAEFAWFRQTYGDGTKVHNYRTQLSAFYIF